MDDHIDHLRASSASSSHLMRFSGELKPPKLTCITSRWEIPELVKDLPAHHEFEYKNGSYELIEPWKNEDERMRIHRLKSFIVYKKIQASNMRYGDK